MTTTIILVRHGETHWNLENRFRGRANIPLDDAGLAQAEITARYIAANWKLDAVYCSPLLRARQTAELIAEPFMIHERSHPGLLDIDYGAWQGHTEAEVRERWSEALQSWYQRPHKVPIPGGESLQAVRLRALGTMREVAERHINETVVLVAHTVVNRLILLGLLDSDNAHFWHLAQDICALNLIEHNGEHFKIVKLNDTFHLSAPLPEPAEPAAAGSGPETEGFSWA